MSDYEWVDLGNGRTVYRRVRREKRNEAPNVISDHMDPVRSAADGRIYDSKSAIRNSYKPSGNPQGARFIEVGNEYKKPYVPPKPRSDAKGIDAAVERAKSRSGLS